MKSAKRHGILSKISWPEDHLGYWMRYVSNNVAFAFSRELEKSGVTVAEWIVLRQMYMPDWISPMDIMVRTGLTQGAISKLMDRLISKGLVIKQSSAEDRRYKKMKLTAAGRKIVPRLARVADNNDERFFGYLSSKQKVRLIDFFKNTIKVHRMRKSLNMHVKGEYERQVKTRI